MTLSVWRSHPTLEDVELIAQEPPHEAVRNPREYFSIT